MIVWPKKVAELIGEIAGRVDGEPDEPEAPEEDSPIAEILRIEGISPELARIADGLGGPSLPAEHASPSKPPPQPNPDIPRHQELAHLLSRFRVDDETAQELGLGPQPAAPPDGTAWEFPRWHYTAGQLAVLEGSSYPHRWDSSRKPPYTPRPAPPIGPDQIPATPWPPPFELTPQEMLARGLKLLPQRQAGFYVAKGWMTPFVRRLDPSDPIVLGAKAARAMLPRVDFATKAQADAEREEARQARLAQRPAPPRRRRPMQWVADKGWMYVTPGSDPYIAWLYAEWARPWLEATDDPKLGDPDPEVQARARTQMFARMGAMATMFQEASPPSINTYDDCVFSYGVGFAIGAPQIVCEIVKDPNIRKLFYLIGLHVTERKLSPSTSIYDIQTIDLFDEGSPNIQVWDDSHHWYGFTLGGDGVRTMAPSGKGRVAPVKDQPQPPPETFTVETDNKLIKGRVGKSSDSQFADGPLSNSEKYYHAYQRLSNRDGREMEVLAAFIAVAEDELTRKSVNDINQRRITARATVDDGVCATFTEAGYTFVSMCVHNWAIPVQAPDPKARGDRAIWLGQLVSGFLRGKDADAVRALRKSLASRPADKEGKDPPPKLPYHNPGGVGAGRFTERPLDDAWLDTLTGHGPTSDIELWWEMAQAHDALVAKGLARIVMSLLEWNRYHTGIKECAAKIRRKEDPTTSMFDEKVRSYNWGWRFKRLRDYWLRMTNGHNFYHPLISVMRGSGIDYAEVGAGGIRRWPRAHALLRQPRGVPYTKFPDFNIATPLQLKDVPARHYPATRGNEFGDGAVREDFYDLGPLERFKLPALMHEYGRFFEIRDASVDRYARPLTATVRLLGKETVLTCDALGKQSSVGTPLADGYEPEWPEAPAPNWFHPE